MFLKLLGLYWSPGKDTLLSRKRAKRKRVPNNSFLQAAETQIAGVLEKVG